MDQQIKYLGKGNEKVKVTVEFMGDKQTFTRDFVILTLTDVDTVDNVISVSNLIQGSNITPFTLYTAMLEANDSNAGILEELKTEFDSRR